MGFFGKLLERRSDESSLRKPAAWMLDWAGGAPSSSGVRVSLDTARTLSVVWACLRVLSDDIAKLPLKVFRENGDKKELVPAHPVNRLLNRKPNDRSIAVTVRQAIQLHAMTSGGGFAEIQRNGAGIPIALHPIHAKRVRVEQEGEGLIYCVTNPGGKEVELRPEQMLHIRGMGDNGVTGQSVIAFARDSMGMGISAQQYAGKFLDRGMRPVGVLKTTAKLSDLAVANLRKSMEDLYGGSKNAGKVPIFDNGLEWQNISINPDDAQFLESRKYTGLEICQWFRCPPHKVFDLSGTTNGSLEQQQMAYVTDSLGFWFLSWEQECHDKLLTEDEKADHYFKHNADAMLRGDSKTRAEAYAIARQNGYLNVNEIRAKEDLPPVDGGELYLAPVNMTTLEKLGQTPAADAKANEPTPTKGQPGPMVDPNKRSLDEVAGTITRIVQASREALADSLRRVLHVETDKATRALKRGELGTWADEFYKTHVDFVRAAVFPIVESIVGSVRAAVDPDGWDKAPAWAAYAIATWHVQTSRDDVAAGDHKDRIGAWQNRAAANTEHYLDQVAGHLIDVWRRSHDQAAGT